MITLAIQFILAHLLGDFMFQPDSWVKNKKDKKAASPYLYLHVSIHFMLLLAVTRFEMAYLGGIIVIAILHYITDLGKLYMENAINGKFLFYADQLLHIFVLIACVYYYKPFTVDLDVLYDPKTLALLACLAFTTYTVSILLKVMLERFNPDRDGSTVTNNAGKYIGILERLFIFFFVVINFWEGVGFLLAAKSIFRFGDLKDNKDVRLTEYILIGTLLSFAFGISSSLLYKYLLQIL